MGTRGSLLVRTYPSVSVPTTIEYLNDKLELRDGRMRDLEARIVDLE